jgi:diguanylate cyclase (GGDEF)-like protein
VPVPQPTKVRLRFRSLEGRIVTLFLVLVLSIQLAGFFLIRVGIDQNARTLISDELVIGERVFRRLLEQNAQTLTQGAQLLAKDYGFLSAIGSDDRETIASALANHGARIGASHTILIGPDRKLKASTTEMSGTLEDSVLALIDSAERNGKAVGTAILDNAPFQIVVVPVRAPVTIGWVAMAFSIDARLATDMRALSSLQVSILTRAGAGKWAPNISTLQREDVASLVTALGAVPENGVAESKIIVGDEEYSARITNVARDANHVSVAVLQRSVSEASAPYRRLQLTLLVLNALGILVAVGISIFTAKRIVGPLRELGETARRLGAGDYDRPIDIRLDDEIGELSRAFESMRQGISTRELEIRKLAYWDTLTDLPNRAQFSIYLNEAIATATARSESCFVLMMDLDRFKNVNDVLGHSFGDALLQKVAQRLKIQLADDQCQLARLGGDEFVILLPEASVDTARTVAMRILKSLEVPISLEDEMVDLGAGIGIAGFPAHGTDAQSLLSHAEVAMYAAKKSGNEALVYEPGFDETSQQSLSLLSEMRGAVDRNEFRLYVQPKMLLGGGDVVGLEALIRWAHPERGLLFPDSFIPFAEKSGFIRVLTRWMLDRAAALCSELAAMGVRPKISVNISARDLLDQDLPDKFAEILLRNRVAPTSFCLEITESAIMDDPVRAQQTLEGLHAMGVELSIDDFGTGYSSLAYLKRLPVQELKIDKSFVMNMERDIDDSKIVRSTIDLGHNMGLRVVAEGIESEAVWELLAAMGCDQGQGYFMSKPLPANQIAAWIAAWIPPESALATGFTVEA